MPDAGAITCPVCEFDERGFWIEPEALTFDECDALAARVETLDAAGAGTRRMLELTWVEALARDIRRVRALIKIVPADHVAVQCTLFTKSGETNWAVAPHQDLSIPVASRVNHDGCSGWSEKEGVLFTQPPADVLAQLVAVRVHIDECGQDAGALRVQPGSHRRGTLTSDQLRALHAGTWSIACAVPRGGAMALRPLLVHASSKTSVSSPRRVLHFLFGPRVLPFGLQWARAV